MNDVDATLAHETREHAHDFEGRPAPMVWDLQMLQPHGADALHQGTAFGNDNYLMPAVANRAGQLHGVELRSPDLHRMRVDEDLHAVSISLRRDQIYHAVTYLEYCATSVCFLWHLLRQMNFAVAALHDELPRHASRRES